MKADSHFHSQPNVARMTKTNMNEKREKRRILKTFMHTDFPEQKNYNLKFCVLFL